MPAKNPRLTITLQPSTAAQLRRISALTGNSQSALIAELLTGTGPVFDRLINVLELAKDAKAAMKGQLAKDLAKAQGRVEHSLGVQAFDLAIEGTLPLFEEYVHRRARKSSGSAGSARATPTDSVHVTPPSNRGVRSTTKQAGRAPK
jgi:hypothetical protein